MTGPASTALANANVAVLLEDAAARRGTGAAIIAPDGRPLWSFEDLAESAARFAGGLAEAGISGGDRVLVLEPDARELIRAMAGTLWAGACVVIPPVSLPMARALEAAAGLGLRAVIVGPRAWPAVMVSTALRKVPVRIGGGRWPISGLGGASALGRHQPIAPRAAVTDQPAMVSFTTGSTGPASAVTRTHGVLRAQHEALRLLRSLGPADRDLAGVPLLALDNLASGITTILPPRGPASASYGERIGRALTSGAATSAAGFPHLFESAIRAARPGDLARLHTIHIGGSRVRPTLLRALQSEAPRTRITVVYGSTEVEPIAAINADDYLARLAASAPGDGYCVGPVLPGLELVIAPGARPSNGGDPRRSFGSVMVRGPRVAGRAGNTGWIDTGDAGRLDGEGRLWLLGRMSNVVGRTAPAGLERGAEALPWVDRAALIAVPATPTSCALLAVVPRRWEGAVARAGRVGELHALARDQGWGPVEIVLVRRLPVLRGPGAKVDDDRLRRLSSTER